MHAYNLNMKRITVKTHKQHISTDYSCTATSITHHKKIQAKIMKAITDCTKLYSPSFAFCDPIIYKHDSDQCFRPEYSQYMSTGTHPDLLVTYSHLAFVTGCTSLSKLSLLIAPPCICKPR